MYVLSVGRVVWASMAIWLYDRMAGLANTRISVGISSGQRLCVKSHQRGPVCPGLGINNNNSNSSNKKQPTEAKTKYKRRRLVWRAFFNGLATKTEKKITKIIKKTIKKNSPTLGLNSPLARSLASFVPGSNPIPIPTPSGYKNSRLAFLILPKLKKKAKEEC